MPVHEQVEGLLARESGDVQQGQVVVRGGNVTFEVGWPSSDATSVGAVSSVSRARWSKRVAQSRLSPGFTMVYGARDENELATVLGIVTASHAYASGAPAAL